ncbi:MAG: succinyl-diaminopimelate desuccinylase [Holosporales bacterium]|jgi:succinyl-diaminopimelate desuccinylase|nr:succinyl-diaminopimelate desuccinylase [Holosporales bacterium]
MAFPDVRLDDPVRMTQELIRLKNPLDCLDFVRYCLESIGFEYEVLTFNGVSNLFAHKSAAHPGAQAHLLFLGHVDVVPPGDLALWVIPPFSGEIVDDRVYGRGSADMKGGIASFLAALWMLQGVSPSVLPRMLQLQGPEVSLLITCDEEGIAEYGAKAALQHLLAKGRLNAVEFAIIGEPTAKQSIGDHIKIGGRGSLNVKVTVTGRAGHVAYPATAINPIPPAVSFLYDLCNTRFDDVDNRPNIFEHTNIEITSINVDNTATNIIPERIQAQFNIRFNRQQTRDSLTAFIENLAARYNGAQWRFDYDFASDPFLSKGGPALDTLVKICEETTGDAPLVSAQGASSDARFLQDICPFAEIGLLAEQAHKINEHTAATHLLSLRDIFYRFLLAFTAANPR